MSGISPRVLREARLLPVPYVLLLLVVFVLPFFSVDEYSILANTTSHLGAQNAPHAWAMNTVFVLLAVATVLEAWLRLSPTGSTGSS